MAKTHIRLEALPLPTPRREGSIFLPWNEMSKVVVGMCCVCAPFGQGRLKRGSGHEGGGSKHIFGDCFQSRGPGKECEATVALSPFPTRA